MARGRFLSKSISLSEQVDELIDAEGYEAGVEVIEIPLARIPVGV